MCGLFQFTPSLSLHLSTPLRFTVSFFSLYRLFYYLFLGSAFFPLFFFRGLISFSLSPLSSNTPDLTRVLLSLCVCENLCQMPAKSKSGTKTPPKTPPKSRSPVFGAQSSSPAPPPAPDDTKRSVDLESERRSHTKATLRAVLESGGLLYDLIEIVWSYRSSFKLVALTASSFQTWDLALRNNAVSAKKRAESDTPDTVETNPLSVHWIDKNKADPRKAERTSNLRQLAMTNPDQYQMAVRHGGKTSVDSVYCLTGGHRVVTVSSGTFMSGIQLWDLRFKNGSEPMAVGWGGLWDRSVLMSGTSLLPAPPLRCASLLL